MYLSAIVLAHACAFAAGGEDSPIGIEVIGDFATFTHREHPDNRIGYRFHEHTPLTYGEAPQSPPSAADATADEARLAEFAKRPGVATYRREVTEEGWAPQTWTFLLAPAADGIDMLLVVETKDEGLPEFHGMQQCFRLSGVTNAPGRHKYALTPVFSEFDLWTQPDKETDLPSLTWVLRNGTLQSVPGRRESVGFRTAYGRDFDERRSGGHLETLSRVGPYEALMLGVADAGLIMRVSADRHWSTGFYWERTLHVTDHHPADCLHAIVNTGGVAPHSKRIVRGKIYWLQGAGEDLLRHWRADFPQTE